MGDMAKERELFEKYPRHIGLLVNAIKNALDKSHVVIKGGKLVLTTGGPTTTDSDHPTKNTDQDQ